MNSTYSLHIFSESDILSHLDALSGVLTNCVNGGASVSFMLPFSPETAQQFWQRTAGSVARDERVVLDHFVLATVRRGMFKRRLLFCDLEHMVRSRSGPSQSF